MPTKVEITRKSYDTNTQTLFDDRLLQVTLPYPTR